MNDVQRFRKDIKIQLDDGGDGDETFRISHPELKFRHKSDIVHILIERSGSDMDPLGSVPQDPDRLNQIFQDPDPVAKKVDPAHPYYLLPSSGGF
uniref:Uncharacterized protein n=1 Tax=Romanomermis culicivorax TaxID=13658 RepID=A0A915JHN9_ROMCU